MRKKQTMRRSVCKGLSLHVTSPGRIKDVFGGNKQSKLVHG